METRIEISTATTPQGASGEMHTASLEMSVPDAGWAEAKAIGIALATSLAGAWNVDLSTVRLSITIVETKRTVLRFGDVLLASDGTERKMRHD